MLSVRALTFAGPQPNRPLLAPLAFDLAAGESLAVCGPKGAGKTLLIRILAGAMRSYAGEVLFQGKELADWSRDFFEATGAVLDPHGLFPDLSILENLAHAARLYRAADSVGIPALVERHGLAVHASVRGRKLGADEAFL